VKKKQTNRTNKELGYINYYRTKSVTTRPIFSSKNWHSAIISVFDILNNYFIIQSTIDGEW